MLMIVLQGAGASLQCSADSIVGFERRPGDASVGNPGGASAGTDFEETRAGTRPARRRTWAEPGIKESVMMSYSFRRARENTKGGKTNESRIRGTEGAAV